MSRDDPIPKPVLHPEKVWVPLGCLSGYGLVSGIVSTLTHADYGWSVVVVLFGLCGLAVVGGVLLAIGLALGIVE